MLTKTFFIDINNPLFFKLSDAAMGINFDEFINFYFENENSFFGYFEDEIEKCFDEYCLEKNCINNDKKQIFLFSEVMEVLEENKYERFLNLKRKYKDRQIIKNKKIIVIFQNFTGKFVDILFIVKNKNQDVYSIINLQVKLSNKFKVSNEDKKLQKYQMTYLQNKYQYIFGIKIIDSYVIYLSLFELKKKFAEDNPKLFIYYSKEKNKLVDNENKVLDKFPFLINAKVDLISEFDSLLYAYKQMLQHQTNLKLEFKRITEMTDENMMKMEITEKEAKIEIKFMNIKNSCLLPNENKFTKGIFYYKIVEKKSNEEE